MPKLEVDHPITKMICKEVDKKFLETSFVQISAHFYNRLFKSETC